MDSPNSMGVMKCRGHLQAYQGFGIPAHFYLTRICPISIAPYLYEEFNLTLISARLYMILDTFWGCLSSLGVMTRAFRKLGLKTSAPLDLVKKHLIPILPPRVLQKQGIQMGLQSRLMRRLTWEFMDPLWRFICSISVSVQH